ncbi:MAG: hypothetical protein WB774_25720, partial [Xanthobacteraceae bacterium]
MEGISHTSKKGEFFERSRRDREFSEEWQFGETVGHRPRTSIVVSPESSPDLCSDLLHMVCIICCIDAPVAFADAAPDCPRKSSAEPQAFR